MTDAVMGRHAPPASVPVSPSAARASAPLPARIDRLLKAQADTGGTIGRLIVTLAGLGLFGVLAVQFPDSYLLTTTVTVNVPLAGPASFKVLLILLPAIMLAVRAYAEILLRHWYRLDRVTRRHRQRGVVVVSLIANPYLRRFTGFVLYPLLPLVFAMLTRKAMVFADWGLGLLCLTLVSTLGMGILAGWVPGPLGRVVAAYVILVCVLGGFEGWFRAFRRPFQLQIADLRRADLSRHDLLGADLRRADLRLADLSHARLEHANLSGADAREADLSFANLQRATLDGANLTEATLLAVDMRGASLFRTRLDRAALLTDHRWFDGAVFRDTSITDTIFTREWTTRDQFLKRIEEWGATLCRLKDESGTDYSGRCIVYWPHNGHFYQLIEVITSWPEARMLGITSTLRGPFYGYRDKAPWRENRLKRTDCLQGYLLTTTSAEEEAFVMKAFGRAEAGGVWLGARADGTDWRWMDGPETEAGRIFWSGGKKGSGGRVTKGFFANWRQGEPNNNGLPFERPYHPLEIDTRQEDHAGALFGWNDVAYDSRLFPVIEYRGRLCVP